MIVKELDPFISPDASARTGRRAEEQMAFYLRRAFADAPNCRVLNGIRLERGNDAAQIDHLILHRFGIIIIESKSVTSRVEINERGEWTRLWNGKPKGMPSPILQAQRQGEFLRSYLEDHAQALLGKVMGVLQAHFGNMPVDVLVAVSDEGIIKQPRQNAQEAVCKADQVADRVRTLIGEHRKAASVFSLNLKGGYQWSDQEVDRITAFLLGHHKSLPSTAALPAKELEARVEPFAALPSAEISGLQGVAQASNPLQSPPLSATFCRACQSKNIAVEYGRYGYYFKCANCDANTPIKLVCSGCSGKARVRKSGVEFFADCEGCGKSNLFHVNNALAASSVRSGKPA